MSKTRFRFALNGLQVEYEGGRAFFDRTVAPLLSRLGREDGRPRRRAVPLRPSPAPEPGPPPPPRYRPPSEDFSYFLRQLEPSHNGDRSRLQAYAFFLWNYDGKDAFREEEVEGCFEAAGLAPPEGAGDLYEDLRRTRMLAKGAEAGTWRLTGKGQAYVRAHLLRG